METCKQKTRLALSYYQEQCQSSTLVPCESPPILVAAHRKYLWVKTKPLPQTCYGLIQKVILLYIIVWSFVKWFSLGIERHRHVPLFFKSVEGLVATKIGPVVSSRLEWDWVDKSGGWRRELKKIHNAQTVRQIYLEYSDVIWTYFVPPTPVKQSTCV